MLRRLQPPALSVDSSSDRPLSRASAKTESRASAKTESPWRVWSQEQVRRRARLEGFESFSYEELQQFVLRELGQRPRTSPEDGGGSELDWFRGRRPQELARALALPAKGALLLSAILEMAVRSSHQLEEGDLLSPEAIYGWAGPRLGPLAHEEVWVLGATSKSRLKSLHSIGRGGLLGCSLLPRDILGPLLREGASGFVLVHNHPSGDPTPSSLDLEMTLELESLAQRLGVPLLDHIVVARTGFVSLLQEGHLGVRRRS